MDAKNIKSILLSATASFCITLAGITILSCHIYIKTSLSSINTLHKRELKLKDCKEYTEETHKKYLEDAASKLKYHKTAAKLISPQSIKNNLRHLTSVEHIAGTIESKRLAQWIQEQFRSFNLDNVMMKKYNVLLDYPRKPSTISFLSEKGKVEKKIIIGSDKRLDDFEKNYTGPLTPNFLAFSPSGVVEGELVYANRAMDADFEALGKLNITLKDKIILIRYGGITRSTKILQSVAQGVKGIILYSDPDIYCPNGIYYPDSMYLPPSSAQGGSILSIKGDPLTRGYPSKPDMYRAPLKFIKFPKVPVQAIGYENAERLFRFLDGQQTPSEDWVGGINVTYRVNSKSRKKIRLSVDQTLQRRDIRNVIGTIRGDVEPDRLVIVGNHRDAWGFGAADPASGTAVLLEVARALGRLKKKGWKPRRTILLCSWDAEEYGLFGSTEWAEEYSKILSSQAVAYLNVDAAVQGSDYMKFKSTPGLLDVIFDATRKIKDPKSNENLYDVMVNNDKKEKNDSRKEPDVGIFGRGSDYMAFVAELGVPALDIRYVPKMEKADSLLNYPVYHTIHDNIAWMEKFIDPDYRYHTTVAHVWLQIILALADTTLLPFNFVRYADKLQETYFEVKQMVINERLEKKFDLKLLKKSIEQLKIEAIKFHQRLKDIDKSNSLAIRLANDQMMLFERTFVVSEDVPTETLTRHIFHFDKLGPAIEELHKDSTSEIAVHNFNTKLALLIYHVMMAADALKNPFTNEGKV